MNTIPAAAYDRPIVRPDGMLIWRHAVNRRVQFAGRAKGQHHPSGAEKWTDRMMDVTDGESFTVRP